MLGKPCWGRKKLAFFPMLRDHVGEAMLGKQKISLFPMLRDHVGEAILDVSWCAIIGLQYRGAILLGLAKIDEE